jgi:hypothetical protein
MRKRKGRAYIPDFAASLESRQLLSGGNLTGMERPHAVAEVGGLAAPKRLAWLIGSSSGTVKGVPGQMTFERGSGKITGIGNVKTSGILQFTQDSGVINVTGPRNQALRLDVTDVRYKTYTSRSVVGPQVVYEFAIDYRVGAQALSGYAAGPEEGRIMMTVRLMKMASNDYQGVYTARFFPAA